ncbi:hypothetical protein PCANB_002211 [Pneumocystis canis]|nr:hypothetical protein PCANB_002211 [Pneumocystis canis]
MKDYSFIIFPGEQVPFDETSYKQWRIGRGLTYFCTTQHLHATHVGKLLKEKKTFYIDYQCGKYIPVVGDSVIGQIVVRHAEGYKVDLGSIRLAQLGALAFGNATRKNRPNLQVGALVYAHVVYADKEIEPDIECIDTNNNNPPIFGELKGGFLIHELSTHLCRKILEKDHPLLSTLSTSIPFEIAVGLNGKIWVNSKHVGITIALVQAIKTCESLNNDEIIKMCHQTIKEVQKWL